MVRDPLGNVFQIAHRMLREFMIRYPIRTSGRLVASSRHRAAGNSPLRLELRNNCCDGDFGMA